MDLMKNYLAIAKKGKDPGDFNKLRGEISGSESSSRYIEDVLRIFPRSKIVEITQGRDQKSD